MIVASDYNRMLLILVSRTQSRIDEVITSITSIKPNVNVKSVLVDLVSQASVRQAADEIKALTPRYRFSPFRFHDYNTEGKPVPPEEQSDRLSAFPPVLSKPVDGYVGFQAYNQSKTANVLFTVELNKRLNAKGIVSYSVHPGKAFFEMMPKLNPKPSIREGASTTLVAAFDPNLDDSKGYYLLNGARK
ncbi:hypothetical protein SLS56_008755 [Neofusicoccum ribis]|uniref:Uncharacterized protein n=1 Tax=Neofusicoccum ribis TaxID=45134 RepID=A0ABR3SKN9_9PEZI